MKRRTMGSTISLDSFMQRQMQNVTSSPAPSSGDYATQVVAPTQDDERNAVLAQPSVISFSEYIRVGDEPSDGILTVDLSSYVAPEVLKSMSDNFRFLPRTELVPWIDEKIKPLVDAGYFTIIKKALINLYNKVNLDECNRNQLDPWDWESQKIRAYYVASNSYQDKMAELEAIGSDPRRAVLELEYASLPKIGDPVQELNREAGVFGLLNLKEYDLVRQIIDAYKGSDTIIQSIVENPPIIQYDPRTGEAITIGE